MEKLLRNLCWIKDAHSPAFHQKTKDWNVFNYCWLARLLFLWNRNHRTSHDLTGLHNQSHTAETPWEAHMQRSTEHRNKTQIKLAQDSSTLKTFHQALGEEKPQGPPRTSLSNVGSFLSVCVSMLITQWTACGSQFGAWSQSLSVVPYLSTGSLEVLLDEETDTCENQVITCWEWAVPEDQPLMGCGYSGGIFHSTLALEFILQKNENAVLG